MNARDVLEIPEIASLDSRASLVRIPPEIDVPLTPRVRRLVDSCAFRRLANVSQLGLVRLVYPGANHTRFEHSLGVYRLALLLIKRLAYEEKFVAIVDEQDAKTLILAALLHDVGHFPYCHLLEDLKIPGVVSHEEAAEEFFNDELGDLIRADWGVDPQNVASLIASRPPMRVENELNESFQRRQKTFRLLSSILSGPIDVDKMDYLMRDSCAAGVPYGKNYDIDRLIGSVCLNEQGDGIAISAKGKTAAELMVFSRYVMFSEVYWHHTSRVATVMFQRSVDRVGREIGFAKLIGDLRRLAEFEVQQYLLDACSRKLFGDSTSPKTEQARDDVGVLEAYNLLLGLFGPQRKLFKRARQFSALEAPELYRRIAGRPYREVEEFAALLADKFGVAPSRILVDAPPVDKEVEFKIDVYFPEENVYRPLSSVSPVVRALAREQFDDCVKRVRIFAAPEVVGILKENKRIDETIRQTLDEFERLRQRSV